jgi:hypothetical protein
MVSSKVNIGMYDPVNLIGLHGQVVTATAPFPIFYVHQIFCLCGEIPDISNVRGRIFFLAPGFRDFSPWSTGSLLWV